MKQAGATRKSLDSFHSHVEALHLSLSDQASDVTAQPSPFGHQLSPQIAELSRGLETTRAQLARIERRRQRDREDIQLYQEHLKETELATTPGVLAGESKLNNVGTITLEDEMELEGEVYGQGDTETE